MAGRLFYSLDCDGYLQASEPGYHFGLTGKALGEQLKPDPKKADLTDHYLFNPAGSEWLLCRPRQLRADWYADPRLDQHVVTNSLWTWAQDIAPVEYEGWSKRPDGASAPLNLWLTVPRVPDTIEPLDATDYDALFGLAGLTLPAGFGTIGFAYASPAGAGLWGLGGWPHIHPQIEWLSYPPPDDSFCFLWSSFAILVQQATVHLFQKRSSTGSWQLLATGNSSVVAQMDAAGINNPVQGVRAQARSLLCLPVGPDWLYLYSGQKDVIKAKIRDDLTLFDLYSAPAWSIAAAPKQRLTFQVQCVGYEIGTTAPVNSPTQKILFDLGPTYRPTIPAEVDVGYHLPLARTDDLETGQDADGQYYQDAETGCRVQVRLNDALGVEWESNGSNHSGGLEVVLTPGNSGSSAGYISPMLRAVLIRFPPKLVSRDNNPLELDDTQVVGFSVETSLTEPDGKRFELALWDKGANLLIDAGLDGRDEWPIEVFEDVDGDGVGEVLRVAAWIREPELRLVHARDAIGNPIQFYRLNGRGIICRADRPWMYLPQMVDPSTPGYLEHSFVVQETLHQVGIDVEDASRYDAFTDPYAGEAPSRLPGTYKKTTGGPDEKESFRIAPSWDEECLAYIRRIGIEWRGWQIYERLDGRIRYHPELLLDLGLNGGVYYGRDTIYETGAEAQAAGYPGQYALGEPARAMLPPVANVIRMVGPEDNDQLTAHVLIRDNASVTGGLDYENFVGEWRPAVRRPKEAHTDADLTRFAYIMLQRWKRRRLFYSVSVPLAPWEFGPDELLPGRVVRYRARAWLVAHVEVAAEARHVYETRVSLERLPLTYAAGDPLTGGEAYPGKWQAS